jgi:hypothetical protein
MNRLEIKKKNPRNKFWNLSIWNKLYQTMVRERGLEPPHLTAHAPKACVSTIPPLARVTVIIPFLCYFKSFLGFLV